MTMIQYISCVALNEMTIRNNAQIVLNAMMTIRDIAHVLDGMMMWNIAHVLDAIIMMSHVLGTMMMMMWNIAHVLNEMTMMWNIAHVALKALMMM